MEIQKLKIGVFSIIPWSFLDQRPQLFAKKFAEWGNETIYIGTFLFDYWTPDAPHPWEKYIERGKIYKEISKNLKTIHPAMVPAHKRFEAILSKNKILIEEAKKLILEMKLDLALVIDPLWGRILKELNIPFIYDHVDDTHHMDHVVENFFYNEAIYCEKNSLFNIYIQPNIAQRYNGLFISNGITVDDLIYSDKIEKEFDAACLSCIADWFDMDSVLKSNKKILLIGPMDADLEKKYHTYRQSGGKNVTWIPRIPRKMGSLWLNKATVGIIPFKEGHGIVDYVMPLKIVEYFYLGMPCVSYVNKGIMEEFGDHVYPYSPSGWLGYPGLDEAIEKAQKDLRNEERIKRAKSYTWDHVMAPLKERLETIKLN